MAATEVGLGLAQEKLLNHVHLISGQRTRRAVFVQLVPTHPHVQLRAIEWVLRVPVVSDGLGGVEETENLDDAGDQG